MINSKRAIFLLIFFLGIISCHANIFIQDIRNGTSPSSICLSNIVNKEFPCGTLISIFHTQEDADPVLKELSKDDCYTYNVRTYENHDWLIPTKMYILITSSAEQFSTDLAVLSSDIFWDPKAHTIVALERTDKEQIKTDGDIEKVFDVLLRYNIFRTLVIQRTEEDNVTVYTYYPFNGTNCGLIYDYAGVGNCSDLNNTEYFSNEPITLRNCNVTAVAKRDVVNILNEVEDGQESENKVAGLEQFMLDIIAQKEGAKMYYKPVSKDLSLGVVLPNGTATGLLGYLQRDEVDIAFGGIILIKNRMDIFEYIWGYTYASLQLYTPTIGEEVWRDVYKEFSPKTWILIALTYCAVTVIWIVIKQGKSRIHQNHDHSYITLKLWGYLYVNTSKTLPKEVKMRRFTVFWIWFTFFISNFYNTALFSLLTNRDQIHLDISVDNLLDVPFEPCISETVYTYFQFSMNKTLPTGLDIPECRYTDSSLDYIASGNNAYTIQLDYFYEQRKQLYLDEDGHSKIEAWEFSSSNVIAMYLTKGFPRTREFQKWTWRMYESGLVEQQLRKMYHHPNKIKTPQKKHFKKIALADLRIHFLILATGSLLSFLCFIIEVVWFSQEAKMAAANRIPFMQ